MTNRLGVDANPSLGHLGNIGLGARCLAWESDREPYLSVRLSVQRNEWNDQRDIRHLPVSRCVRGRSPRLSSLCPRVCLDRLTGSSQRLGIQGGAEFASSQARHKAGNIVVGSSKISMHQPVCGGARSLSTECAKQAGTA